MYGVLTTLCIFVPHLPLLCPDSLQDLFGNAADSADRDGGRGKFGYFSFPLSSRGYSTYIYFFLLFQLPLGSPDVIPTSFKLRLLHKKFLQFGCGRSLPAFANVSVTSSSL